MREVIGAWMFLIGALGAALVFLAPMSFWEHLDPAPGGRAELTLLFFSAILIAVGALVGIRRPTVKAV